MNIRGLKTFVRHGNGQCFGFGSFCPDPDLTFFPESVSGSRQNPDPDPWKNARKIVRTSKQIFILGTVR